MGWSHGPIEEHAEESLFMDPCPAGIEACRGSGNNSTSSLNWPMRIVIIGCFHQFLHLLNGFLCPEAGLPSSGVLLELGNGCPSFKWLSSSIDKNCVMQSGFILTLCMTGFKSFFRVALSADVKFLPGICFFQG